MGKVVDSRHSSDSGQMGNVYLGRNDALLPGGTVALGDPTAFDPATTASISRTRSRF